MSATIYANATIRTLDPPRPRATALVCRGEHIIAVGDRAECWEAAGAGATEIDLGGACVLPGLTDAHIHLATYARNLRWVSLRAAASAEDAARRVAAHAATLAGDAWVLGGQWDFNWWSPPVPPSREALDAACPARPVVLSSRDAHSVWVNGEALRRAGIDRSTPDPAGGEIVRDERGEPTGLLREAAADDMSRLAGAGEAADLDSLLGEAFSHMLAAGLTSVHDIDGEDARAAYERAHERETLPLRIYKSIPAGALDAAIAAGRRTGDGDHWLRTGPVKLFADGALGSHTAAMLTPYAGEPHNSGIEVTDPEQLAAVMDAATDAGIAIATHAIGDRANRTVLDAYAALRVRMRDKPGTLRHRIEHAQHLSPKDLPRLAELDVIASMQPIHATSDIETAGTVLTGHDLRSYAWRDIDDAGTVLAFGSDAPVEDSSPLAGMHAALTRQRPDGVPAGGWQPEQCLGLERALIAYTYGPAYASGEESIKGRLAPGMLADFVVLGDDPFTLPPERLLAVQVDATAVGGHIRWQR